MTFVDTHCHLTDTQLAVNLEAVINDAVAVGVTTMIAPSTSLSDAGAVVELTQHEPVYGLVGVHPESLDRLDTTKNWLAELRQLLKEPKILGIGEIGLDLYHQPGKDNLSAQLEVMGQQLQLALEQNIPVAIHMREAQAEMVSLLRQFRDLPPGQFHCFAGDLEFLEMVLDLGFHVSFCGNVTYPSADNLRQACKLTPLERLLLETDSPYLAPQQQRGKVNTPANVKITADFVATLLDVPINQLAKQTSDNAQQLYKFNYELNTPTNS